ncbi:RNA-binding protein [Algibacter marinivivus]|uniref:RNA-binding protein n=1 Tax=Algibacter marinivivus TaxID=2100723 RepID=A0A2U2X7N5_9FLAO|nr:VCBS repeat-containing protein [Algibacter marinivivus]PWH83781.1 RNA-binding protein [Algibacter marinivivus]
MILKKYLYLIIAIACLSCKDNLPLPFDDGKDVMFTNIPSSHSNINFQNKIKETPDFNFLNYSYIYNGGGVAVGDINNDGLEDIYFTSNQNSNKLYLNKGNFVFEDITESAGVKDDNGWSTGVTMVDINNDGWLDIYVCKSASIKDRRLRQNKLYINQKNNKFKEQALEYGLKEYGFSTQAYFFDYDKDGDLDMYLVNHSLETKLQTLLNPSLQTRITKDDLDKLFRNDNGKFVDVSKEAGIQKKAWGLSASIGDFNNDNWPDIYIANDFLEPDFLWINNKDGTFKDEVLTRFKHISNNSMGSDFADINNDLKPDLVVLDMSAADRKRGKENMASMDIAKFNRMVNRGWHHQYMSNMLQLNMGNGTYSEIGQFSGIAKTDWSWAPLVADFNNDGYNDVFVTNGIERDIANQDFRQQMQQKLSTYDKEKNLETALQLIPSAKLENYMFLNNKDATFKDMSLAFGFDAKVNSNGAAYADFDNDGDLDLVLNNQSDEASIYRNNSTSNYLKVSIEGSKTNRNAIGAKVLVFANSMQQVKGMYVTRGYQSSVTNNLIFGLGELKTVDSLKVIWNDGKEKTLTNIKANQNIKISYNDAKNIHKIEKENESIFETVLASNLGIDYKHKSVNFNDYNLQVLLPQKQSTIDAALTVADVNNDGLEDLFLGNTAGFSSEVYFQNTKGEFTLSNQPIFEKDKAYNDNNALFFDADNDGDVDVYVASGNYSLPEKDKLLQDRLYINNGKGEFSKGRLPNMLNVTKAITADDFDGDGDIDLFVGGRVVPGKYPKATESYLLENRNGTFTSATTKRAKALNNLGLVNDAVFSDYDGDGDSDLIVVGEWMPVTFFNNHNGIFKKVELPSDSKTGWFQTIKAIDFDNDGDEDYFVGNMGENNKFHPTESKPLHVYANYFDDNDSYDIALSKSYDGDLFPLRGKECSTQQTPFLKDKIGTYKDFANATIIDVYGKKNIDTALHLKATTFSSFYIENEGDGNFQFHRLPHRAQFGPTLDFEFLDVNKDEKPEVIGVGVIYDAEVETIRYDASQGYILKSGSNSEFKSLEQTISNNETKAIEQIRINDKLHLVLFNADSQLQFLKLE